MKYLVLIGGLGNQMFEYAFLLALRRKNFNVEIDVSFYDYIKMHNGYELERVFGVKERIRNRQGLHIIWLRFLDAIHPSCLYMKDELMYNSNALKNPRKYNKGYWQDERYFIDIEEEVRSVFAFKNIDEKNVAIAKEMSNCNSISLHIRRGDYASYGMNLIGEEYYCNSVRYINDKIDSPVYYIFSDDVKVAESIANQLGVNYIIINHNTGLDSYKDIYLMSQCKHNIIANSSFSWWGAWLNVNKNKIVIAPNDWDLKKPFFHPQSDSWILL